MRLSNTDKIEKKYSKFLKDKRVVLVGPAWHTKNTRQHDLIESYDIVVRMNVGHLLTSKPKHIKDIGKRTDILYCALSDYYFRNEIFTESKMMKYSKDFKWISLTHANWHRSCVLKLMEMNRKTKIPIHIVGKDIQNKLISKIKKKLSAGIVTIADLLKYEIKELYITGISFYDTEVIGKRKYYKPEYNTRPYSGNPLKGHDIKKEFKFFMKMLKNDERIKCDEILEKIVENRNDRKNKK